jgi:cobaltochelatase CobS
MSIKIASTKRDEFRRVIRNHPKWNEAKQELVLEHHPDSAGWLAAAEYLGIDTAPYEVKGAVSQPIQAEPTDKLAASIAELIKEASQPIAAPLDEKRIIELIQQYGTSTVTHTVEVVDTTGAIVNQVECAHKALAGLVKRLQGGLNVYLLGGAGGGKTTMAEQAAEALGLDFYSNGALLMKYEAIGHHDANGNYQTTQLREAFEKGGVWLLDEADASAAEAIVAINAILANGSYAFPDKRVQRHENFVAIAAANTNGKGATRQYVGRNPLDDASLDRFIQFEITYDANLEQIMGETSYKKYGGTDNSVLNSWIAEVREFRTKTIERKINVVVSPRSIQQGATLLALGISIEEVREETIYKHLSSDQRSQMGVS